MASAAEQVDAVFNRAVNYADSARAAAATFLNELNASIYTPPTLSVTWETITAPVLASLPSVPSLPTIAYNGPAFTPSPLAIAEPTVTIDDFSEAAPSLSLPSAPSLSYGSVPSIPSITVPTIPSEPVIGTVTAPTLLSLSAVTVPSLDLHESWLTELESLPTLSLLAPTQFSYARGSEYASTLLSSLKTIINNRLSGGTGLNSAVEQAIWDRARDRETQIFLGNEDEVTRQSEASGFVLPAGTLAAQLRSAQDTYYAKLSGLSRDIAIKQAELEQDNLKHSIEQGIALESRLIDYALQLEQLAFQAAKQYADNAIQVHNAAVEQFKALLVRYQTYADAYRTIIDGQKAKVEVYRAQLEAEKTKVDANKALVDQYEAQVRASLSSLEVYKAQLAGAQTLVELEKARIQGAGEQIRAYVAQVNAETSKVEAYKAQVEAEKTKIDVYEAKVRAFAAKVSGQADKARAEISRYQALQQAKSAEWDGYRAQVSAEAERIKALGTQSEALLGGYKAATQAIESQAKMQSDIWRANISQYEASQNIAIQTAKINNDATLATNAARLDAAKAGAQIYAQLTASAYGMIKAQADIDGRSSMSVSYNYSGETSSAVSPIAAI